MDKLDIFKEELREIRSDKMKEFAEKALNLVPEYFFTIPASSGGRYHPSFAQGEGGLVRHTKCAVKIAIELFRFHSLQNYTEEEKDMIIIALILHDSFKSGYPKQQYTVVEHPLLAGKFIRNNSELKGIIDENKVVAIAELVETHMGEWNKDRYNKEVLPLPKCGIQKFVALCDYLASRKCLECNFDTPVKRD